MTTASTGDGVAELLAFIDRHRGAATAPDGQARLTRAETQVWAIVGDRVRGALVDGGHASATAATLAEVAGHALDPYAAADRLLDSLERGTGR